MTIRDVAAYDNNFSTDNFYIRLNKWGYQIIKTMKKINAETPELALKQYAEEISKLQVKIENNDQLAMKRSMMALNFVINAGELLNEAKELVKHGEWEKWLAENVSCISKRTAENYMKLAKNAKDPKNASMLTDIGSLKEAYERVGILRKKDEPATGTASKEPKTKAVSPQQMRDKDNGQYKVIRDGVSNKCVAHVRNTLSEANGINWNLASWTIQNNKPHSGDSTNSGGTVFTGLRDWIAKRENENLVAEDEVSIKAGIVLIELVKTFVIASQPPTTGESLAVKLMDLKNVAVSMERQPVTPLERANA